INLRVSDFTNYCRDLAISAPTGSGKTLCYLIPIINSLSSWVSFAGVYALIVAPVQALVVQIENEFNRFNCFNIPTAVLSGSHDMLVERRQLESALVVFATPGRLTEHLFDCDSSLKLSNLRQLLTFALFIYLVVDEADRMHHIARLEWLDAVEVACGVKKPFSTMEGMCNCSYLQKILISATLSHDVENLYMWKLRHPRLFRFFIKIVEFRATKSTVSETVDEQKAIDLGDAILPSELTHRLMICESTMKPLAVYSEIISHPEWKKILIFVNNKLASQRLTVLLKVLGKEAFLVEELSSNLFGRRRFKVLSRFKSGIIKVLVSSDVLSRGIDVEDIDVIFNYSKPKNGRHFIHRVGRTARCGKKGVAVSVVTTQEVSNFLCF
uniref:ATP-dependent RNA helicase n=1 Tax=Syphacia muris TaxID=451379 RepID=A0A0N5AGF4_9BILA